MSELINTLLMPFSFAFMHKAFVISVCVAVPMALLSCYVVLKGWALLGDAVSHAVLPGVVIAWLVGLPLGIGAFVAGMVCAVATGYFSQNSRLREDSVMGIVFAGMFGIGVVLFTIVDTGVHLNHILFGNILGVNWNDVGLSALIAVVCVVAIVAKRRDLLAHAFDPQHSRAIGLPGNLLHYGLLSMLAATIVGALKAAGIILAIAYLVAPGAIAFLLTRRFERMLVYGVLIAVGSSLAGAYASFFIDSAPAPTIVLMMTALFIVVFLTTSIQAARLRKQQG